MRNGKTARPQKWSNIIDLYDDGEYSAIWGIYDKKPARSLGVRWNGDIGIGTDNGFPVQGKHPLWFVEPPFFTKMILLDFLQREKKTPASGNIQNIQTALNECP
jgi:hypothetical protein